MLSNDGLNTWPNMFTPEQLPRQAYLSQAVNACYCSAFAISFYDYIYYLNEEIDLMWPLPWWSLQKFFYNWNRYLGLVAQTYAMVIQIGRWSNPAVSVALCDSYAWIATAAAGLRLYTMQICLMIRLHAMCGNNPKLKRANYILLAVDFVITLTLELTMLPARMSAWAPGGTDGCWGIGSGLGWVAWVPSLVFEVWLCLLAVRNGLQHYQEGMMVARRSSLLWTILFDNVACFVCTASLLTINIVVFATAEGGLRTAMIPYSNAFTTVIGCRILLNTRQVQVAELKRSIPNTTDAGDLSTFCARPMSSCILTDHTNSSEKHTEHHMRATSIGKLPLTPTTPTQNVGLNIS